MYKYFKLLTSLLIVFILLTLASGCGQQKPTSSPAQPAVKKQIQIYNITAPKPGKVIGLILEKGERISKDQPLFAIADELLNSQVNKVTTEVAKAEAMLKVMQTGSPAPNTANIPVLQAQVDTAQQKAAKMNQLLAIGGVSRMQAQTAQSELQQAKQALANAQNQALAAKPASPEAIANQEKQIKALKEQQSALHKQLQQNEVVSPATCIVKDVKIKNGDNVNTQQILIVLEDAP